MSLTVIAKPLVNTQPDFREDDDGLRYGKQWLKNSMQKRLWPSFKS